MVTRRRRRLIVTAAVVAAMVAGLVQPATTQARPARAGTIVGGVFTTAPAAPCQIIPDCAAWLASGCNPALAGRDPAWLSSIVDVRRLADGTTPRTLVVRPGPPDGILLGDVYIQFWRGNCIELRRAAWDTFSECPGVRTKGGATYECEVRYSKDPIIRQLELRGRLPIPKGATWMTITGNDNLNITWSLT